MTDEALDLLLNRVNRLRAGPATPESRADLADAEAQVESVSRASCRLAVYGSLAPRGENHGLLAGLPGVWAVGAIRGVRFSFCRGGLRGLTGLRLDPAAAPVAVWVFDSPALPGRWWRLDGFEGPVYRRVLSRVDLVPGVQVIANVYVADPGA